MGDAAVRHVGLSSGEASPESARARGRLVLRLYWLVVLGMLALSLALTVWYAPVDQEMGLIQKLIYFHLAVAISTFASCLVTFVAGVGYLWQRDSRWDGLGEAGARASVALCAVVLLTGVIWAKQAWGVWWEWNPPLTFSLVLWFVYAGYLATRRWLGSSEKREGVCAIYGIIAFCNVPLVYLSVKLLPQQHPSSLHLTTPMRLTLIVWLLSMFAMTAGLIATGYLHRRHSRRGEAPA